MAVNIEVNLQKIDSTDLSAIKAQLESLDEDIDLDLDFGDILNGEFEEIKVDLDEDRLVNQIRRAFHKVGGEAGANFFSSEEGGRGGLAARTQTNQLERIITELEQIRRTMLGDNLQGGAMGRPNWLDTDIGRYNTNRLTTEDPSFKISSSARQLATKVLDREDMEGGRTRGPLSVIPRASSLPSMGADLSSAFPGDFSRRRSMKKFKQSLNAISEAGESVRRLFGKLRPSFRRMYAITATLLPAVAGLAVQLGAVALAVGSLAAIGGVISLLGMLGGKADTLEGSMKQAEERMKSFKRGMFQAIEPVADLFAPIVNKFLDQFIIKVAGLRSELASLRTFSGIFFQGLDGAADLASGLLKKLVSLEDEIKAIGAIVGEALSQSLMRVFSGMIKEGNKTLPMLMKISELMFQVARGVYFLLKAVVRFVGALTFLTFVVRGLSNVLGNKFLQTFIAIVGVVISLVLVMYSLAAVLDLVVTGSMAAFLSEIFTAITAIPSLIAELWAMEGVLTSIAATMAVITGGLALLGAVAAGGALLSGAFRPEKATSQTGGGYGTYNDVTMNFQGDMDSASRQRMVDTAKGVMYQDSLEGGKFGASR